MSDWHRQHGQLELVSYAMVCDFPGCGARVTASGPRSYDDIGERAATRAIAEQHGWYTARDRGVESMAYDLCPEHRKLSGTFVRLAREAAQR